MGIMKERCFPRGGRKSASKQSSGKNKKVRLFDPGRKKKKDHSKVKKSKTSAVVANDILTAEHLTYQSLTEGMILLGCVVNVAEYYIKVSLPGRLVGKVPIINISGPYTKILKSLVDKKPVEKNYYDLTQMFKPGHFIVARVLKVAKSAETSRYEVELTLNPESVNANYVHSGVRNGMILQGSVKSIEDHGCMIDFGIKSLTAFLKNENAISFINSWNDGRPLGVGQVVMCGIQRVEVSPAKTVVQVTLDPQEVSSAIATNDININTLMPGTLVKSLVVENIRDGLMVEFLNFKGFVYRDHVGHPPPKLADVCLARILYTIPLLNTVYLSVLLGRRDLFASCAIEDELSEIKMGQIVRDAEIVSSSKRGIMLTLGKNIPGRAFVSRKRLMDGGEITPGDVKGLYPTGKKVDVRIIGKDLLENMFICSSQQSCLDDDYFCINDLEVGMKVEVSVVDVMDSGVKVKLGRSKRLNGFVPLSHLADFPILHPHRRFSKGMKINARVLRVTKGKANVLLTFKPSLIDSDLPILNKYDEAANTKIADGTVVKILDGGLLVMFFNDVTGYIPISNTGSSKPGSLSEAFYVGQTVRCSVVSCIPNQKKLKLSLLLNTKKDPEITSRLGHFFTLKVIQVNDDDLVVKILKPSRKNDHMLKHMSGTIPNQHLSDHASLTNILLKTYQPGSEISSAVLYSVHYDDVEQPVLIFSLRVSVMEFCQSSFINVESNDDDENQGYYNTEDLLEEGTVIPCSVLKPRSSGLLLEAPVPHSGRRIYVPYNLISDACLETVDELTFPPHKLIFGKVMRVDRAKRKVLMATKLSEVWSHHDLEPALTLLKSYLAAVDRIRLHKKMIGMLGSFMEGQIVKGTVKSISQAGASVEVNQVNGKKLKDNLALCCATVLPHHYKSKHIKVGEEVVGRVIFVDFVEGNLYLTLNTKTVEEMERAGGGTFAVGKCVRVEILVSAKNVAVSFTKGNVFHGEFVYLPVQNHYNDDLGCVSAKRALKPGDIVKVIISGKQNGRMIGLVKKDVNAAKKCAEGKDSRPRKRESAIEDSEVEMYYSHKRMKGSNVHPERIPEERQSVVVVDDDKVSSAWQNLPRLQTAEGFVWGVDINSFTSAIPKDVESSGDEEIPTEDESEKRKCKVKNDTLREESCLREAEQRLMDAESGPLTADDYDRLVLSSPDSSIVWLKYVAFHLQNIEIDKARAVAQRALKTINFREEQEKFNVWVCLFNLENLYGTKESLEKVIQEALRMNEPLKVYCQMLHIYLDSNKIEELDNLMEVMLKKHKSDKEAWIHAGRICMKLNRPDKAGELLRRSFKSLQKHDHVDVTCRWAQLEARFGSIDRAQSLLEGVLVAYPKRTDIWSSLVDTLVSAGSIEEARNILERAICQRLPVRKMKILFKKYLLFEEKYGSLEGTERVRRLAMDYVEKGVEGAATC